MITVQETNLDLADVIGLGELVEKNPTLLAGSTISEVHLRGELQDSREPEGSESRL